MQVQVQPAERLSSATWSSQPTGRRCRPTGGDYSTKVQHNTWPSEYWGSSCSSSISLDHKVVSRKLPDVVEDDVEDGVEDDVEDDRG